MDLWLFAKVFSGKFGGVASFGAAKRSNLRKFSPQKIVFFTNSQKGVGGKAEDTFFSHLRNGVRAVLVKQLHAFCELQNFISVCADLVVWVHRELLLDAFSFCPFFR